MPKAGADISADKKAPTQADAKNDNAVTQQIVENYGHKNTGRIEMVGIEEINEQKAFKGARTKEKEWLRKENKVRQKIDAFYTP